MKNNSTFKIVISAFKEGYQKILQKKICLNYQQILIILCAFVLIMFGAVSYMHQQIDDLKWKNGLDLRIERQKTQQWLDRYEELKEAMDGELNEYFYYGKKEAWQQVFTTLALMEVPDSLMRRLRTHQKILMGTEFDN